MSTQSNLYSISTVATHRPSRIRNQKIYEDQRRFSAMTRNLTPAQVEKLFQNMQMFIASECPDDTTPVRAKSTNRALVSTSAAKTADVDLSAREQEVLILVSNGYSRREIGDSLDISVNTAARHISNIYRKLGVTSVAEATRYAMGQPGLRPAY